MDTLSGTKARAQLDEAYRVLTEKYDYGFMDGGCYLLAKALFETSKKVQIKVLVREGRADHYLVKVIDEDKNSFYLDYDGIYSTEDEAIEYYITEGIMPIGTKSTELKIVDKNTVKEDSEIPSDDKIVTTIKPYILNVIDSSILKNKEINFLKSSLREVETEVLYTEIIKR